MGLNCIITVPGQAKRGHGHPTTDRSGPIEDFLVDNQVFYKHVRQHLSTCLTCDPKVFLEIYLDRRRSKSKFKGVASGTFVANVICYIKIFEKRGQSIPKDLLAETIGRGLDATNLIKYETLLGVEFTAKSLLLMRDVLVKSHHLGPNVTRLAHMPLMGLSSYLAPVIDYVYDSGGTLPPKEELEDLTEVAMVMLA